MVLLFTLGSKRNEYLATSIINSIKPILDDNFYQVGTSKDKLYIKDSAQNYTSYASGRVNIASLTVKIDLAARQNIFFYLTELIVSTFFESVPAPEDRVNIIIRPSSKINSYIFAIVNKEGMNQEREDNYYLSLTKTTESSELPNQFVYMSESAELNANLPSEALLKTLSKSGKLLKSLAISDLPSAKPTLVKELASNTELLLSLSLKTDSESLKTLNELVEEFIDLADKISKFELKSDQQKKINNIRIQELNKIEKAIKDQQDEELKEKKLEAEKEARRKALENLSPEEQDKLDKKQREKRDRRAKNKQFKTQRY